MTKALSCTGHLPIVIRWERPPITSSHFPDEDAEARRGSALEYGAGAEAQAGARVSPRRAVSTAPPAVCSPNGPCGRSPSPGPGWGFAVQKLDRGSHRAHARSWARRLRPISPVEFAKHAGSGHPARPPWERLLIGPNSRSVTRSVGTQVSPCPAQDSPSSSQGRLAQVGICGDKTLSAFPLEWP